MRQNKSAKSAASLSKFSWGKITEYTDTESEVEKTYIEMNKPMKRLNNKRTRSANSIPSKTRRYGLVKYPQINLEYYLPNCPEKYLLPVRFPYLYKKIMKSIANIKTNNYEIKMREHISQSGVMLTTKNKLY